MKIEKPKSATTSRLVSKSAITTDDLWKSDPQTIRNFLDVRHEFEQLCAEVEYILRKRISQSEIQTSFIGSRAKTLNSFVEKQQRKNYDNPLTDVTDLAGVRVVCLYSADLLEIEKIIRTEFTIIEEINKLAEFDPNQFGYRATHFIVKLGKTSSGARYDDLKNFVCEIQIRTVVQDAWAIIQHHMAYKKESQIPPKLHRKLNSLAALFETVDDQFELIRNQRDTYLSSVREILNEPNGLLDTEINMDSLIEYLKWTFPDQDPGKHGVNVVLDALKSLNYKKLDDVDKLLKRTETQRIKVLEDFGELLTRDVHGNPQSNIQIAIALAITSEAGQKSIPWGTSWLEIIKKHQQFK
ncbi:MULTISPECIES: hypothetical protein [unclassified Pseudomonas]|uniref:GTP pyrophosphokinase n=1 Tax=unclassified Pseudomonas TaxID=196821 RepID=UPI001A9F151A|nr:MULTISPECIES: hypothetical protein [unclassified Pseudomonas]